MPLHAPSAGESASRGGAQHGLARDGGVAFDLERLVLTLPEARTGFYHVHAQALAKIWEPFWCERKKSTRVREGISHKTPTDAHARNQELPIRGAKEVLHQRAFAGPELDKLRARKKSAARLSEGLGMACATLSFRPGRMQESPSPSKY